VNNNNKNQEQIKRTSSILQLTNAPLNDSNETKTFNNKITMFMNPILPKSTDSAFQHTPTEASFAFDASLKQAATIMPGIVTQQEM